jgi:SulP family sulfate permease
MNEGSKLMESSHPNFQTISASQDEDDRTYLVTERRSLMPRRKKQGTDWKGFFKSYARSYIPPLVYWLPKYSPKNIVSDLLAGVTVGVMVIPQGLSFALIANVEPVIGLYVAMVTSFTYFLLGSSKYLIVGPTAVLSLLVGGFTKQGGSPELFLSDALLLSFLSGIILMILSFLRLGFLTNLLSKPISVGFTAGAAILISMSQIKNIFGIPMETPETIIALFKEIIHLSKIHAKVNGWAVLMFVLSFAYIMIVKQIKHTKMVPAPLFALIMGTVAAWGFDMHNRVGLAVVGEVPKGLPKFTVPITTFDSLLRALPFSFVVAFLCFVEAFTIAKPLAIKEGNELGADQELFALGVSNLLGSFLSSFPAAGSFTRTAVNYSVGAKSQFSGLVSAVIVLFSILFLTPLLRYLPFSILASIVMSGVINLFEIHDMKYIWKTKKRDFVIMVLAFCLTLLLGVDMGVLASIAIHVLLLVVATIKMRVEEMVYAGDGVFVHILDDPDSPPVPGIILAKVTDSLVYLNIESFMKQVETLLKLHGSLLPHKLSSKSRRKKKRSNGPTVPPNTISTISGGTDGVFSASLRDPPPSADVDVTLDLEGEDQFLDPSRQRKNSTSSKSKEITSATSTKIIHGEIQNGASPLSPELSVSAGSGTINDHPSSVKQRKRRDRSNGGAPTDALSSSSSIGSILSVSSSSMDGDLDYRSSPYDNDDLVPVETIGSGEGEEGEEETDPTKKYPNAIVFDFSMVNSVDSSAMLRLEELRSILATEGYSMHFAHVHSAVLEVMFRGDFLNHLGNDGLFISLSEALKYLMMAKEKENVAEITLPQV